MAKSSKLLSALERRTGRNINLEKQRKQEKAAAKRKAKHNGAPDAEDAVIGVDDKLDGEDNGDWEDEEEAEGEHTKTNGAALSKTRKHASKLGAAEIPLPESGDESASGEEEEEDDEEDDDEENPDDIPLSDIESLASEDRADVILHQRLTINNTAALLAAYKSIAISSSIPFSHNQSVTSSTQTEISDVHDDLTREQAFYKQCLEGAIEGRSRLKKEGVPFTRPNDFFAEMVKTDEQMGKIKSKMIEEAAGKKAAAEARKQRDLKKFGKAVQVAKQQERDKAKRETLDKINVLKRKRKDGDVANTNEEDLFDVALDNEIKTKDKPRRGGKDAKPDSKRQKKDSKFGYGGKKRFSKSGDAQSTGDISKFSTNKMKGKKSTPRPGKSKRNKF